MGYSYGSFNVPNYGILEVVVPVEAKPLGFSKVSEYGKLQGFYWESLFIKKLQMSQAPPLACHKLMELENLSGNHWEIHRFQQL